MNLIGYYMLGDRMKYEITTLKNKIFIENELYENNKLVLKCKKDYCYEVKKIIFINKKSVKWCVIYN
jgi:hypothetical protein